ncbi:MULTISPECIES: hypothetical protein [unclassified Rathayibacter]|uniref:hypothetical protein n=1 Tax=unclassified Rathayibacter TaxID=2609250 RepID=UPI0011B01C0B|nr:MULTISPECIES: hypothetical protein [unclassified Rathayibacter]
MTAATCLAAALIATSSPVNAAETISTGNTDSVSQYLEEHPDIVIADDAVLSSDSVIVFGSKGETVEVIGDDAPSEARTSGTAGNESAQVAAACSYRNASFVNVSGWVESTDGCGIIGYDSTARWSYSWTQDKFAFNSGPSCVQGRGYSVTPSVSTPVWYTAGCGGSGSANALIGNRATVAKIRGYSSAPGTIGYVRWK